MKKLGGIGASKRKKVTHMMALISEVSRGWEMTEELGLWLESAHLKGDGL